MFTVKQLIDADHFLILSTCKMGITVVDYLQQENKKGVSFITTTLQFRWHSDTYKNICIHINLHTYSGLKCPDLPPTYFNMSYQNTEMKYQNKSRCHAGVSNFFIFFFKVCRAGAASIISLLLLGPPAVCLMVLSSLL